jgi:hypothetical protein
MNNHNLPPLFHNPGGGRNHEYHVPPPMSSPSRESMEEEKQIYKTFVNSFN